MVDWSQGSAHPLVAAISDPYVSSAKAELQSIGDLHPGHRKTPYRGSTPARPRHGVGTRRARANRRVDARPHFRLALDEATASAWPALRNSASGEHPLPSDDGDAWAGIACWGSDIAWLAQVYWAYGRHYQRVRSFLCDSHGVGGVSLRSVLRVAAIRAKYADWHTGRNSFPSVARIMRESGYSKRLVQRATKCLRLLGCATEVLRGRLRTLDERLNCHQIGDRHRGWTSVYALHPPYDAEVIHKAATEADATKKQMTPHLVGSLLGFLPTSMQNLLLRTSTAGRRRRDASRRPAQTQPRRPRRRPHSQALLLASQWLRDAETPLWAHKHSPTTWAYVCEPLAAHGWCPRDINQLLVDHRSTGGWIADSPRTPIILIRWLISRVDDLANRPAAADMARDAEIAAKALIQTPPVTEILAGLGAGSTPAGREKARAMYVAARQRGGQPPAPTRPGHARRLGDPLRSP